MTSHSFDKIPVKISLTTNDAQVPKYSKSDDAGADIYAVSANGRYKVYEGRRAFNMKMIEEVIHENDWVIHPKETVMIQTGLKYELNPGWEFQCRTRSGSAKNGLVVANSPGTLDAGYRGLICVLLRNNTMDTRVIKPGDRIAQLVLKRVPQAHFIVVDEKELSDTDRGGGGFGSTGTK